MATKKEKGAEVFVRYMGNGKQFFIGVDARDLTKDEFEALEPLRQRDVLASSLYEAATAEGQKQEKVVEQEVQPPSADTHSDTGESENN